MQNKVIILGAGGHAKVIADIVLKNNDCLIGFLDDNISTNTTIIKDYKVIGKLEKAIELNKENNNLKFVIGIGDNLARSQISKKYTLPYYTAIHPNAVIGIETKIGIGTVVMANASVNSNSTIGKHCIINTGAVIEHDNILEDYVHISPNATLGGTVKIGEKSHIGIGATVKNNINICKNCIVGAGAVIVKDIKENGIYIGVPAKRKNII